MNWTKTVFEKQLTKYSFSYFQRKTADISIGDIK